MSAALPYNESQRLVNLREHHILDTPNSQEFDDIVRLAASICAAPISAVTLVDEDRQWFKSIIGLTEKETPREIAFCAHTILTPNGLTVLDATKDARFANNSLVLGDAHIRFYTGIPLVSEDGYALGSLCVIDRRPRRLSKYQKNSLRMLANLASALIAAQRQVAEIRRFSKSEEILLEKRKESESELQAKREFESALMESLQEGIVACDANGVLSLFNDATRKFHGQSELPLSPQNWANHFGLYHPDGCTMMKMEEVPLYRAFMGEVVTDAELVIVPEKGQPRTVLASGKAIYSSTGQKLGAVVAMHEITERIYIERELSRLAAIVESSEEAIIAATLDGIITAWNKGAERLYGYHADEVLGCNATRLAGNNEPGLTSDVCSRVRRGESIEPMEVVRGRKDGTTVDVSLNFSPIKDLRGEMVGISCISRDISRRKQAELALAESEARLRLLSDAAFEGIAVSINGALVDANGAYAAEFGYEDPALMYGLTAENLATNESRAVIQENISSGHELPYEATLRRKDGSTFIAECRGRQTQIGGRTARITAIRNVTQQKNLERAIRESEEALRAVLDSAPIILYAVDTNGIVTLSEGTGLAALGLKPGEAVGKSVFDYSGGNEEAIINTQTALAGGAASYDIQMLNIWLHTQLRPVRDDSGNPAGFIGVCFDVTERVASEERFRVLFEQSSHAHVIFDEATGIIDCNQAAMNMVRCTDKKVICGIHPSKLSPEMQPNGRRSDELGAEMCELARTNGGHHFEWQRRTLDGDEYPIEVTITPVTLGGKSVLLAVWNDLSERKRYEQKIHEHAIALESANAELAALATTDGLTGILNHRAFQQSIALEVSRAERSCLQLSLIMMDIDHFKQYNDDHGHPAGDIVLKIIGKILKSTARETDIVARYGGEEFAVIAPSADADSITSLAERIRGAIEVYPWPIKPVTASLGVASLVIGTDHPSDLISRADRALYGSKREGRNRVSVCGINGLKSTN
jgi:diguanylate cyclase (GGDEF)-like protein/PAS domain S-box-containing protein